MRTATLVFILFVPSLLAAEVVLPFELDDAGSLRIRARVGGRAAILIVDTGAATTILDPALAGVSAAEMGRSHFDSGGVGFTAHGVWREVTLGLGGEVIRRHPVGVVDLSEVRKVFGKETGGILGRDVLRRFRRVEIDFDRRTIRLTK